MVAEIWQAVGSAAGGTLGSLISGLFGYYGNQQTNNVNQNIANQNLQFQRENLDYQKALQQQLFEREDTAYQRTVNDMRMSGLNPLSMQGTNGAGEAIATEPMHNDFQFQNQLAGVFDTMNAFMNMKNNSTLSNAQANLINAQADNQKIKNQYEEDMLINALYGIKADNIGKDFENNMKNIRWLNDQRNYNFNEQFGLSDNMPDYMKLINIFTHQGSGDKNSNISWLHNGNPNSYGFYQHQGEDGLGTSFKFNSLDSVLQNTNLKGALMENKLGSILLQLLGIK